MEESFFKYSGIAMASLSTEFHGLKLLTHCGGGAYGDVFYCEDISGKRLAIKIVSKKKLGDSWSRELKGVINYRKITEHSPELLQIFHVEEDEEHFFYTMEAADSVSEQEYRPDTLASRLNQGPLPHDEVFGILSSIFAGIRTIHEAGFAHRDIKPDNILFVKGIPKLSDIGLMSTLTATSTQLAGTIEYLPPEVRTAEGIESSSQNSTQQNDLYAFGKVIYCAVTGQKPQAWPTIPKELPLTLPFKLFLRLSLRLCDKDLARRIHSINEIEKELTEIKRKLETGETLQDKIAYQLRQFLLGMRSVGIHFVSFLRQHWLLSLVVLGLVLFATWYFYPEAPFDISKQETQQYTNAELGITMTVPFQWDIVSKETFVKMMRTARAENEELTEWERKRIELVLSVYESGIDSIYPDYEISPKDNITIVEKSDSEVLFEMNTDEIKLLSREVLKNALGCDVGFYEVKKTLFQNYPCIYLDYILASEIRINAYVLNVNGRYISISLGCNKDHYTMRREQFTQVLQTIKFGKVQNPVSENGSTR